MAAIPLDIAPFTVHRLAQVVNKPPGKTEKFAANRRAAHAISRFALRAHRPCHGAKKARLSPQVDRAVDLPAPGRGYRVKYPASRLAITSCRRRYHTEVNQGADYLYHESPAFASGGTPRHPRVSSFGRQVGRVPPASRFSEKTHLPVRMRGLRDSSFFNLSYGPN